MLDELIRVYPDLEFVDTLVASHNKGLLVVSFKTQSGQDIFFIQ